MWSPLLSLQCTAHVGLVAVNCASKCLVDRREQHVYKGQRLRALRFYKSMERHSTFISIMAQLLDALLFLLFGEKVVVMSLSLWLMWSCLEKEKYHTPCTLVSVVHYILKWFWNWKLTNYWCMYEYLFHTQWQRVDFIICLLTTLLSTTNTMKISGEISCWSWLPPHQLLKCLSTLVHNCLTLLKFSMFTTSRDLSTATVQFQELCPEALFLELDRAAPISRIIAICHSFHYLGSRNLSLHF